MLKIKDNVDLKELEKFGFKKHQMEEAKIDYYKNDGIYIVVILKDRTIDYEVPVGFPRLIIAMSCLVEDLIKADLVEKVE